MTKKQQINEMLVSLAQCFAPNCETRKNLYINSDALISKINAMWSKDGINYFYGLYLKDYEKGDKYGVYFIVAKSLVGQTNLITKLIVDKIQ